MTPEHEVVVVLCPLWLTTTVSRSVVKNSVYAHNYIINEITDKFSR